jgi:CPA2 family monovalent cation:H+ antiporter-2
MPPYLLAAGDLAGSIIIDLAVVLVAAAAVALLMQRMRLAVIPGYLIAGTILGPGALKLVHEESLESISSLAIILLMFGIGLQLHLSVLRHNLARMVFAGAGSCVASVVVGWPTAMAFGLDAPAALAVAMALSLSSTAVVLRIIADRRELHHTTGRLALSILVIQDLLVLLMLAALPALSRWQNAGGEALIEQAESALSSDGWLEFLGDASIRVAGIATLIVFGRLLLPRILHESARGGSAELLMLVSVAAAIGAAMVTERLGFSLELGAFLAGFLLAGTPFRHHLIGQVGPLRDLFIAVFFTAVGMALDPAALLKGWWIILLGGAVMSALKTIIIGGTCWALGAPAAIAAAVGFALAQAGEFSLVLLGSAGPGEGNLNLLSADANANAIAIVVVSLVITPALVGIGRRAGGWLAWLRPAPWFRAAMLGGVTAPPPSDRRAGGRVVIGGYGPVGRRIAQLLENQGVETIVIELNPVTVSAESKRGRAIIYGDVSNEEVLRSAGLEGATALVLTIPDEEAALRACAVAKRIAPSAYIVVRTTTAGQASLAESLGAEHVVADEEATAEIMQRAVTQHCRLEPRAA